MFLHQDAAQRVLDHENGRMRHQHVIKNGTAAILVVQMPQYRGADARRHQFVELVQPGSKARLRAVYASSHVEALTALTRIEKGHVELSIRVVNGHSLPSRTGETP